MIVNSEEVKAYRETVTCDCGGELKSVGYAYPTAPPKYPHSCVDCGERHVLSAIYPRIVYK